MSIKEKILKIQKQIGGVVKNADNPFYKSKYADINALLELIKPALNKEGLILTQPVEVLPTQAGFANVVASIITDVEGGESIGSKMLLHFDEDKGMQGLGSAITYARRYTLQSLLAIEAEDDDGNSTIKDSAKPKSYELDGKMYTRRTGEKNGKEWQGYFMEGGSKEDVIWGDDQFVLRGGKEL